MSREEFDRHGLGKGELSKEEFAALELWVKEFGAKLIVEMGKRKEQQEYLATATRELH